MLINGVSTDSRGELAGKLFIPISGENFDGHDFIGEALSKGAAAALSEKDCFNDPRVFRVGSVLETFHALAAHYKGRFSHITVAVTGSTGKTTSKDMIASVLSRKYKTMKSKGNLNNQIGLPISLFELDESYEAAVLEMGMNSRGEIRSLSLISKPDVAVITNIGVAHIGNFGSKRGILEAKAEIFEGMDAQSATAVLNGDDPLLAGLDPPVRERVFFGLGEGNAVRAYDIAENGLHGLICGISFADTGESFRAMIPYPGKHMAYNALAAAAVGHIYGVSCGDIKAGLESFKTSPGRLEIIECGNFTVISDVYNSNPASLKASIDVLAGSGGYRTAILGDILELGQISEQVHLEAGEYAAESGIDRLIAAGGQSAGMAKGFNEKKTGSQECVYFRDKESLVSEIGKSVRFKPCEKVLIKASRAMAFESVKDYILNNKEAGYE